MVLSLAGRLQKLQSEETKGIGGIISKRNEGVTRLWVAVLRVDGNNAKQPPALHPFCSWPVLFPFLCGAGTNPADTLKGTTTVVLLSH